MERKIKRFFKILQLFFFKAALLNQNVLTDDDIPRG